MIVCLSYEYVVARCFITVLPQYIRERALPFISRVTTCQFVYFIMGHNSMDNGLFEWKEKKRIREKWFDGKFLLLLCLKGKEEIIGQRSKVHGKKIRRL